MSEIKDEKPVEMIEKSKYDEVVKDRDNYASQIKELSSNLQVVLKRLERFSALYNSLLNQAVIGLDDER